MMFKILSLFVICNMGALVVNAQSPIPHHQAGQPAFRNQRSIARFAFFPNRSFNFLVRLKDNRQLTVRSKIYADTVRNKHYLRYKDKPLNGEDDINAQRIYCDETIQIARLGKFGKQDIQGIPTDSCWLFRIEIGVITVYSTITELDDDPNRLVAFRVDNGPIEPLEPERLEPVLKDNKRAYRAFQKGDYLRAIRLYNDSYMKK